MALSSDSIILHQYDISPFSEKVRVVLGIKGLEWHACRQPVIMPKPELVALTGGYRRIPVMQIGADIYCDSAVIVRELERRHPSPTLFPAGDHGLAYGLAAWSDKAIFNAVVVIRFGDGSEIDEAFVKDREKLSGRFDAAAMRRAVPAMTEQLRAHWDLVEAQLADGRPFLTGAKPGLADASVYHNLAFLRWGPEACGRSLDGFTRVLAWEQRVKAIGHGTRHKTDREAALAIARQSSSTERPGCAGEPNGLAVGDRVVVAADDYGRDPIEGELVSASPHHVAIRRREGHVGEVTVHFPRAGFIVKRAS
ncbi:glutathione S-transferase family protein [Chelatococcus reniformis]|uniref:Glutathione S-transferase n=1 Tax=Chelatococcus reniformis TaxID=1494448 RepID=A0A916XP41_9HYPH|nr:glutathione S-transferase family protein [Chelatococcus reniformis]GGC91744.1 glutathione S-transferase [Chelatococcus reniformis]